MAIRPHMWPYDPSGPKYGHTGPYDPTCGHLGQMGRLTPFVPPPRSASPPPESARTKFSRARVCVRVRCDASRASAWQPRRELHGLTPTATPCLTRATAPRSPHRRRRRARPAATSRRRHVCLFAASSSLPLRALTRVALAVAAAVPTATADRSRVSTRAFAGRSATVHRRKGHRFENRSESPGSPF